MNVHVTILSWWDFVVVGIVLTASCFEIDFFKVCILLLEQALWLRQSHMLCNRKLNAFTSNYMTIYQRGMQHRERYQGRFNWLISSLQHGVCCLQSTSELLDFTTLKYLSKVFYELPKVRWSLTALTAWVGSWKRRKKRNSSRRTSVSRKPLLRMHENFWELWSFITINNFSWHVLRTGYAI